MDNGDKCACGAAMKDGTCSGCGAKGQVCSSTGGACSGMCSACAAGKKM